MKVSDREFGYTNLLLVLLLAWAVFGTIALSGCKMVAGAGQDITWLAEKLETVEK